MDNEETQKIKETFIKKQQAYLQELVDKWADLFQIGSWKFTAELKENGPIQFRYNCQEGTVALEITYEESLKNNVENLIVYMFTDFSLIHTLLPQLKESGDQYLDHDDRNIKPVANAILKLSARQEKNNEQE